MDFTKFGTKTFDNANELKKWVVATAATISTVVEIVCDASGKYVIFYITT